MKSAIYSSEDMYTSEKLHMDQKYDDAPILIAVLTYFSYALLYLIGQLRDFLRKMNIIEKEINLNLKTKDFVPLLSDFESFYTRNMYRRISDCWNRPIKSAAGAEIDVMERHRDNLSCPFGLTGKSIRAINMGSYNYLGFGDPIKECTNVVFDVLDQYGISTCSTVNDYGYLNIHKELDETVAKFVGKEAAICFSMGFASNSANIQALVNNKCCIISDELNHASLILGARLTGSKICTYKHNDMKHLESVLRDCIIQGRPKNHRNWEKIILLVEGIYSMEGSIVDLPAIVELKKKYKFYIYLDEAHSIGCIGPTGRGVVEHFSLNTDQIDIMMGTFTKSFGSCGGYIAASRKIINHIKSKSYCSNYSVSISPSVCAQIIATMKIISGEIGENMGKSKLVALRNNIEYFRNGLKKLGFIVYGNNASPVIPLLIYIPGKLGLFSRSLLEKNIAAVVVGFPATSVVSSRARFCISSSHTREMLDHVLNVLDHVGLQLCLKYSSIHSVNDDDISQPKPHLS